MIGPILFLMSLQATTWGPPRAIPAPIIAYPAPYATRPHRRRPAQSLFTIDDYPASAIGTGAHGKVGAMLRIDEFGRVTDCDIFQSSGNSALDHATCNILARRSRYDPARTAKGTPVAAPIAEVIDWQAR